MRFCHVTTFYPPHNFGGDGILVQQICQGLARRGHEVDVVHCVDAYQLKGTPIKDAVLDPPGIHRYSLRSGWGFLSPLITQQTGRPGLKQHTLEHILSTSYDVVHFHNVSLIGGPGVLRLSRAPVTLYTAHDHWLVCPAHVLWKYRKRPCERPQCFSCSLVSGIPPQLWRYTKLLEQCLEHVDMLLMPGQFAAQRHREAGINRPMQVLNSFSSLAEIASGIPSGVDSGKVGTRDRSTKPVFVYAGRLEASKGIWHLLDAFRERPGYELLIAGSGVLADTLKSRYADCTHIRFLGVLPRDQVAAVLRGAVAVVSPSWGPETFPLVNIEAMSCGTPVIARRGGGSVESIERTGGGLIYDQPEQLLHLVDRIAADPELRSTLARKASEGYEANFSEARWMEQYFELIGNITEAKSARAH
jgi:glycosyltransferase involved in cell wall biosynthesis